MSFLIAFVSTFVTEITSNTACANILVSTVCTGLYRCVQCVQVCTGVHTACANILVRKRFERISADEKY